MKARSEKAITWSLTRLTRYYSTIKKPCQTPACLLCQPLPSLSRKALRRSSSSAASSSASIARSVARLTGRLPRKSLRWRGSYRSRLATQSSSMTLALISHPPFKSHKRTAETWLALSSCRRTTFSLSRTLSWPEESTTGLRRGLKASHCSSWVLPRARERTCNYSAESECIKSLV